MLTGRRFGGSADPGMQYHTTINEWHTCTNDGEIRGSNPCSEYMFLDETACNLYQINLIKFYNSDTGVFDEEAFAHCVRLSTIILEISVLMSQLPSKTMAVGTHKYRTLGLGYANMGTLIMQMGHPYDSEAGFAVNATVSAIMGGESYATSAEMAALLSPFERYRANKDSMLRVIRNHRKAAYNKPDDEYEGLTVTPMGYNEELTPKNMVTAAKRSWDYALALGEQYGYRNAQVTCIAPTGTSGLVMDCDTTGIEPDFALVKFKKLVGGGYFKIVNQSIKPALKNLGYPGDQIKTIIEYAIGKQTLSGAPHINDIELKKLGFEDEQIAIVEAVLPSMFELKYAFSKHTIGEDFLKDKLGISEEELNNPSFDLLTYLGFNSQQIEEASDYICGVMTVEGAPYLKQEHYAVFDCANKCGNKGTRYISYKGHLKQMAAAQPFISGAISKTINMPEDANFQDVSDAYMESWNLMLKATALYRDSSKLSQPLNTSSDADSVYAKLFDFSEEESIEVDAEISQEKVQEVIYKEVQKPYRRKMPKERHSITHKFEVSGHKGYITVGLFDDGTPGEVFLNMGKEGSTLSGIVNALTLSMSLNLQYGVPLETIVRKFSHVRFEPNGMTDNPEIPMAKSLIDYVAKCMAIKFLDKDKAKFYHNEDLVDKAYSDGGSQTRLQSSRGPRLQTKQEIVARQYEDNEVELAELNENEQDDESLIKFSSLEKNFTTPEAKYNSNSPAKLMNASKVSSSSVAEIMHMQQQMAYKLNNEDAPACSECGSVTIRNGACYKCPDCGSTTGCS